MNVATTNSCHLLETFEQPHYAGMQVKQKKAPKPEKSSRNKNDNMHEILLNWDTYDLCKRIKNTYVGRTLWWHGFTYVKK